jgi:hypothetical protein
MIGRTIVGVERPRSEYGDYDDERRWLLRLDDGTAVEFAATGWEVDEVTVTHLTPAVLHQREVDREREAQEREEERQRWEEANARKQAHIAEMRAKLDPDAFERWRRETYPEVGEILKDTWTGPMLQQMTARSPLLDFIEQQK